MLSGRADPAVRWCQRDREARGHGAVLSAATVGFATWPIEDTASSTRACRPTAPRSPRQEGAERERPLGQLCFPPTLGMNAMPGCAEQGQHRRSLPNRRGEGNLRLIARLAPSQPHWWDDRRSHCALRGRRCDPVPTLLDAATARGATRGQPLQGDSGTGEELRGGYMAVSSKASTRRDRLLRPRGCFRNLARRADAATSMSVPPS